MGSKNKILAFLGSGLLGGLILLSSCGPHETSPGTRINRIVGNSFSTKLDLVLVLDESTSASFKNKNDLANGVANFVTSLLSKRDDWRLRIVAVSLNDPNRHSLIWQNAPEIFPDGSIDLSRNISSQYLIDSNGDSISEMFEINEIVNWHDPSVPGMFEPGLDNLQSFMNGFISQSSFIRSDAQLGIVVFSNGNDFSESVRVGNFVYPQPIVDPSYFNNLASIKNDLESHIRFFSIVSYSNVTGRGCNNQDAEPGGRYITMQNYFESAARNSATTTSGQSYNIPNLDICNQGTIDTALNTISRNIIPLIKARFNRAVTYCRPDYVNLDTIPSLQVKVNGVVLDKDSDSCKDELSAITDPECQGWVYEGWRLDNPNSRVSPEIGEALPAGHIIRFNGSGQFFSGDIIEVSC